MITSIRACLSQSIGACLSQVYGPVYPMYTGPSIPCIRARLSHVYEAAIIEIQDRILLFCIETSKASVLLAA